MRRVQRSLFEYTVPKPGINRSQISTIDLLQDNIPPIELPAVDIPPNLSAANLTNIHRQLSDSPASDLPALKPLDTNSSSAELVPANLPVIDVHSQIQFNASEEALYIDNDEQAKQVHDLESALRNGLKCLDSTSQLPKTFQDESAIKKKVKVNLSNMASKRKHYKTSFDDKWLDSASPLYRDWIQRVESDPKRFFDLACNESYDCDYLKEHEATKSHKSNYASWKTLMKDNRKIIHDVALGQRICSIQCKIILFLSMKNAPYVLGFRIRGIDEKLFSKRT